ncbi:MAG TPA: hypothetical protein VHI52_01935 [Verrucomicrobiae bacterium]|nr:hypothetical protein [Verrucomicrobiae bacterium]
MAHLLGEQSVTPGLAEALPKRRFSAATIAKMRAAQRARWAARKTENTTTEPGRARRRLSAAARARLSEVAKARWKKAHAAGKSTL